MKKIELRHRTIWKTDIALSRIATSPQKAVNVRLPRSTRFEGHGIMSIISPGGYLRGMTRAFQQGQLNLMDSLIGLSERKRQDQEP